MTVKVFWKNPYQTELTSTVTRISDKEVELSHTIFYAESGGQESDAGTIDGIPIVGAIKSGSRIVYTLEALLINSVSGAIEPAYLLPISSVSDEQAYQG